MNYTLLLCDISIIKYNIKHVLNCNRSILSTIILKIVFIYKAPILWQWAAVKIHLSLIREPAHLQSISSAVLPYPNMTCRQMNNLNTS